MHPDMGRRLLNHVRGVARVQLANPPGGAAALGDRVPVPLRRRGGVGSQARYVARLAQFATAGARVSRAGLDARHGRQGGRVVPWQPGPSRRVWLWPVGMLEDAKGQARVVGGRVVEWSAFAVAVVLESNAGVDMR